MTLASPAVSRVGVVRRWLRRPWPDLAVSVVRVLLVVAWLTWAALAWWPAPRPVPSSVADQDIAQGRVASFTRGSGWQEAQGPSWESRTLIYNDRGLLLVWTTGSGQMRYTAPDFPGRLEDTPTFAGTSDSLGPAVVDGEDFGGTEVWPATDALAARLSSAAGSPGGPGWYDRIHQLAGLAAALTALTFLGVLIAGPRPVRGTRPFWFWIGLSPFGLGVLAWLALERPWSRRAQRINQMPLADATGVSSRRGGGSGFLGLIAISIVVAGVVSVLRAAFGPGIVPH